MSMGRALLRCKPLRVFTCKSNGATVAHVTSTAGTDPGRMTSRGNENDRPGPVLTRITKVEVPVKDDAVWLEGERPSVAELEERAFELRSKLLHLCGTYEGAVHIGGDLSAADIFTALFHYGLRVDPHDISNPRRDRFLLSKGHAAVCMYIAMSMRGFFSYEGIVETYGQLDSAYGMHPCKVKLPGVEASTGSLGH